MHHRRLVTWDTFGVDQPLNETDGMAYQGNPQGNPKWYQEYRATDNKTEYGIGVRANYYVSIIDTTKGRSKQREQ
jgi:hypothetical protein